MDEISNLFRSLSSTIQAAQSSSINGTGGWLIVPPPHAKKIYPPFHSSNPPYPLPTAAHRPTTNLSMQIIHMHIVHFFSSTAAITWQLQPIPKVARLCVLDHDSQLYPCDLKSTKDNLRIPSMWNQSPFLILSPDSSAICSASLQRSYQPY